MAIHQLAESGGGAERQNSQSGFSSKKVRISSSKHHHIELVASLGASFKMSSDFFQQTSHLTISQNRLAKLADIANNTIIKIEQGKNQNPTIDTLKEIAKALNVSVDDIIR